jgi:putative flippase GtrA
LYKVFDSPLFISQVVAAEVALFSNFIFHHHWTYKASNVRKTISKLIVQFHLTSWMAIIGSALIVSFGVHVLKLDYLVALVLASASALFWNFGWSKFVIWRRHSDTSHSNESQEVV